MPLLRDARRFLTLRGIERRRLGAAAAALSWVAILLRTAGYASARRRLERRAVATIRPLDDSARQQAKLDAWAIRACASRLPWGTCLRRSLALWWLLRRRGIDSEIHFGARLEGGIEAHAWLELEGRALTDPVDPRTRFGRLEVGEPRSRAR